LSIGLRVFGAWSNVKKFPKFGEVIELSTGELRTIIADDLVWYAKRSKDGL
jgi:hypothetical protein